VSPCGPRAFALGAACTVAACAVAACQSFVPFARARTLGRGHWEVVAAPSVSGAVSSDSILVHPQFDVGVRVGVHDRLDIGARAFTYGGSLTSRIALVRAPSDERGIDVSLAPALTYSIPNKLALEVPLLLGVNLHGGHAFVFSMGLTNQLFFPRGGQPWRLQPILFVTASVGFAWRIAPVVSLVPVIGVACVVARDPDVGTFTGNGVGVQAGVGVVIGAR